MKRIYGLLSEQQSSRARQLTGERRGMWTWQATAAACGLGGGVLASLTGSLMLVATWVAGHQDGGLSLYGIGSGLLLSTIPLLMLGAHFLDLSERRETRGQQAQNGPHGIANSHGHARARFAGLAALLLLLWGFSTTARAQQTVFNVPTTDVLDAGKVYFELDISAKPNEPKFSSFVPRGVVGVGGDVEIGLNVTGNIQPGADSTTLVPAVKWKVYNGGDNGWAMVIGNNIYIPVRNKSYDAGTYAYTTIQKTLGAKTRVGFGGYFFSKNVVAPNANRLGGQFTFEHTVTKRLNFNADWFTGKHANGYLTIGGAYKVTPKLTGVAAYSIGNQNVTNGNHFLYFEVGYNPN